MNHDETAPVHRGAWYGSRRAACRARSAARSPWRVGVLIGIANDALAQARLAAFQKGMQELGWTEGRNVRLDVRFTAVHRLFPPERAR
jgi:hypothetical protein